MKHARANPRLLCAYAILGVIFWAFFLSLASAIEPPSILPVAGKTSYSVDWDLDPVVVNGAAFSGISLDIEVLPRFLSAHGVITAVNGNQIIVSGTCVFQEGLADPVVCDLRAASLHMMLRNNEKLDGSIEIWSLFDQKYAGPFEVRLLSVH